MKLLVRVIGTAAFITLIAGGVYAGLKLIEGEGPGVKIAGVFVLGLTTGVSCVGAYIGLETEMYR